MHCHSLLPQYLPKYNLVQNTKNVYDRDVYIEISMENSEWLPSYKGMK